MITSKDNSVIKLMTQIKQKKYSKENKLCLVETYKIINELYSKQLLTHIVVSESKYNLVKHFKNIKIDIISDKLCNYLSDSSTSDGVFGICKIPENHDINYCRCLILDGIQDPSNIGAIIRSANAFGYTTIFAVNSVYPYSYKCIRASMGYIFDINFIDTSYDELLKIKKDNNMLFISADMNGEIVDRFIKNSQNIALIIGNEGNGVSDKLCNICDKTVSIPMQNGVESLNASVSAGILMYLLKWGKLCQDIINGLKLKE